MILVPAWPSAASPCSTARATQTCCDVASTPRAAAGRALPGKRLRVFADLDTPVRARTLGHVVAVSEAAARLLVERGVRAVDGGWVWSSDPRLTLPTMTRMTESQIENLVAGIECPVRAIFADPAQPYLPDDLRRSSIRRMPSQMKTVLPKLSCLAILRPSAS